MNTTKQTYFISDIHLDAHHPQTTEAFLAFLSLLCAQSVRAIYILGDLFEAWIGDDDHSAHSDLIKQHLKRASSQGIEIYFLVGNRDFLLGKRFAEACGCVLIEDETVIQLGNQTVLLMHGDSLCTRDTAYMKSRNILRHPWVQYFFLHLPLSLRRHIAKRLRDKSGQAVRYKSADVMDVVEADVECVMRKQGADILIHGHTHKPKIHNYPHNRQRVVLGAWEISSNAYVWEDSGRRYYLDNLDELSINRKPA